MKYIAYDMNNLLLILMAAFFVIVVVLPLIRLKLTTGTFGVVIRKNSTAVEDIVRVSTSLMFLGLVVLGVSVATIGLDNLQPLFSPDRTWLLGAAFCLSGMLVVVMAQAQMGASWRIGIDDEPTSLCTKGLYGFVRHPIYSGVSLCLIGVVLVAPVTWSLVLVVPGFLLIALQARLEEAHMLDQHGDAFLAWAAETGRIFPGVGRLPNKKLARIALGRV